jgi:lysophospholipase L1-like esterase
MYYHFDYNGAPRSYRWVDTTPLEKINEQMTMAYDYGVDRIWVTNVGDLKFNEAPIDYWFKLAYDIEEWGGAEGPDKAHRDFAAKEFGEELADDIADIIFGYTLMNNIRKPEIVHANTFSLSYFNESETLLAKYQALADKALEVKKKIPPERMDAYYNLVLHPTLISWNAWNLMINLQKNQAYQALGLTAANDYADIARAALLFDNFTMYNTYGVPGLIYSGYANDVATIKKWLGDDVIAADENSYYCVGDGKYYGYYPRRNKTEPYAVVNASTDGSPIFYLGLTAWNHRSTQFAFTTTGTAWSRIYTVAPTAAPSMVVLPQSWVNASIPSAKTGSVALRKLYSYGDDRSYIDVGNTSLTPFDYTAAVSNDWIVLDKTAGTVNQLDRINVSIDWSKLTAGSHSGSVTVTGAGAVVTVTVTAEVFDTASLPDKTFIETDGYVSILSKNYAKSVSATKNGVTYEWTNLPNYGRELSSMKVSPNALDAGFNSGRVPGVDAPYLEYNVYIKTPGAIDIITQWAPTNGMDPRQLTTINYGVQLGDDTPQVVNSLSRNFLVTNGGSIMWADGAESATRTITLRNNGVRNISQHNITAPGVYTLRIYMVNDGLTLQKILVGTNTLARSNVAAANNATDTMTAARFNYAAYTTPTILTGSRDGQNNTNAAYLGPPESFFTDAASVPQWVGTWGSGQYYGDTAGTDSGVRSAGTVALTLPGSTLRQLIRTSVGGQRIRLTFSNQFGTTPLTINAASVAKANGNNNTSNIDVSTNTAVTFNGGSASVIIPAGRLATSDSIYFPVAALTRVAVSTYFGTLPTRVSSHIAARGNSYIQTDGNAILNETLSGTTNTHWFVLSGVDVLAPQKNKSIVAFGDSITDGYGVADEQYTRWVDALMNNLQGNSKTSHLSVINMGIGTNSLLTGTNPLAARTRFERDVLNQPGVGYVVFQIGVNDLPGSTQTANNMIAAYDELFKAATAKGIKVYAGTISPRGSSTTQDANRQTVNAWIRQQYAAGNIDGKLVDFDELLRNPSSQNTLVPVYMNDSIHPNAAGYKAMGDYVYNLILGDL